MKKNYSKITKSELIENRWYLGRGRNSNIGYWDGRHFLVIGFTFNQPRIKVEDYYNRASGTFQPFMLIDEGKITAPFGEKGWKRHYGKTLACRL